jgi:hypothetical protein
LTKVNTAGLSQAKAAAIAPSKPRLPSIAHYYMRTCEDRLSDVLEQVIAEELLRPDSERRVEITQRNTAAEQALLRESPEFVSEMRAARQEEYDLAVAKREEAIEAATKAAPAPVDSKIYVLPCGCVIDLLTWLL